MSKFSLHDCFRPFFFSAVCPYNGLTCYQAFYISKLSTSLATHLTIDRRVERAEICRILSLNVRKK